MHTQLESQDCIGCLCMLWLYNSFYWDCGPEHDDAPVLKKAYKDMDICAHEESALCLLAQS